jgi:ATP-dependent protease Clp ATPase subunit
MRDVMFEIPSRTDVREVVVTRVRLRRIHRCWCCIRNQKKEA